MILGLTISTAVTAAAHTLIDSQTTASTSIAVVSHGKIAFRGAFGLRDVDRHLAATPDTLYRIGSITKVFTAIAIMQLVEQHKLSLDDTLAKYEPGFPNAATITIKEMLMHRSGIKNYLDAALSQGRTIAQTTPQAIVDDVAKSGPESAPGTGYAYSNTNYVLLGLIVERITGEALHAYYKQHIFAPAGMTHTYAGKAPAGAPVAVGYELSKGRTPVEAGDPSWYYACGDALSTASDLARFDIALMNGKLVHESTLDEMIDAAMPTGEQHLSYGLGLMRFSFGKQTIAGHHGGLPGFEADDEMILGDQFAVVSLGNDFLYPTSAALNAALETYYADDFAAAVREAAAAKAAAAKSAPEITARCSAFLTALLAGKVDDDGLSSAMASALKPGTVAAIDQQFAPYGAFQKLEFVKDEVAGPYRRYHYVGVFANKRQPMIFVLDANQRLAGFFNE